MCGAETWARTKADISRLTVAQMRFLRGTERKTKTDRIRNKNRENIQLNTLEGKLTSNRTEWYSMDMS
jgi:hypothetical protein